jgi:non-canonical purine NTP pyrophosphatase (RdgB/HAM1 family)
MSQRPVFITGNQAKADYLARHLGIEIEHQKIELDELQSLDLHTVVEHKVRQAYDIIKKPVLVEDVSLEFVVLGRLPGTFIKFFGEESSYDNCCRMLDGFNDRSAVARCTFGYYDGEELHFFDGELAGRIAETPRGDNGFGWDRIFIPDGYEIARAEMDSQDDEKTYTIIKPFAKLREFLHG